MLKSLYFGTAVTAAFAVSSVAGNGGSYHTTTKYMYQKVTELNFYDMSNPCLQFEVKAKNDAHIGFFKNDDNDDAYERNEMDEMYEIVIGGWGNNKSVIRDGPQHGDRGILDKVLLDQAEYRTFWIAFNELADGGVQIQLGNDDVNADNILATANYPSFKDINYAGFSTGWGSEGDWKNPQHCTAPGPMAGRACGTLWGDPHFVTYDYLKYDCQGKGEFVLTKTPTLEVHGRFEKPMNGPESAVTVTRGIAFKEVSNEKVTFTVSDEPVDGVCNPALCVGDSCFDAIGGIENSFDLVKIRDGDYEFKLNSGAIITVIIKAHTNFFGCYMNANVCLPPDRDINDEVVGLFGTPDHNMYNEWMEKEGPHNVVDTSELSDKDLRFEKAYDYCMENWCVASFSDSLFTSLGENAFNAHNTCEAAYDDTLEKELENVETPSNCGGTGHLDCILETVVGGDEESAGGITEINEVVEKTVTDPVTEEEQPEMYYQAGGAKPAPNVIESGGGGARGDPHIKTWNGLLYDYHGVCDLILLSSPSFQNGLGLDVHMRTKKTRGWSSVSSAVVKIGKSSLEIMASTSTRSTGSNSPNRLWYNSAELTSSSSSELYEMLHENKLSLDGGYSIRYTDGYNKKQQSYIIDLVPSSGNSSGAKLVLVTWKSLLRVDVVAGNGEGHSNFGDSVGLMGRYPDGEMLARDGKTDMSGNYNDFGSEWQVQAKESGLLHGSSMVSGNVDNVPQHPAKCEIGSKSQLRRRLATSGVSMEDAKIACSSLKDTEDYDLCIFDVMATGDLSLAAGAY